MKKLLYTLLVGLVIVSCDKNELGEDNAASSINIIEQSIDENLFAQDIVLNILNRIQDGDITTPKATKGSASLTNKSSDYVVGHVFSSEGAYYLTLLDESNDDLCFGELTATPVYLDNVNGDGSAIAVEDADGVVSLTINGNFAALFSANNNSVYTLNATVDNITAVANFTADNTASF